MKRVSVLLLLLVVLTGPPVVSAQDWSQYRNDAAKSGAVAGGEAAPALSQETDHAIVSSVVRLGDEIYYVDDRRVMQEVNATTLETDWTFDAGGNGVRFPMVEDGSSYVAGQTAVYRLDGAGDTVWRLPIDEATPTSPALGDGTGYVGTARPVSEVENTSVYAFDTESGSVRWQRSVPGVAVIPPTLDRRLYQPTLTVEVGSSTSVNGSGLINAFGRDGDLIWQRQVDSALFQPVATSADAVIASTENGRLFAFEKQDGATRWSRTLVEGSETTVSSPATRDSRVYLTFTNGSVAAFRIDDGTTVWRTEIGGVLQRPVAVTQDRIFAVTVGGTLHALSRSDGVERWNTDLEDTINVPPTVTGSTVYLGGESSLHAVSLRENHTLDDDLDQSPASTGSGDGDGAVSDGGDGEGVVGAGDRDVAPSTGEGDDDGLSPDASNGSSGREDSGNASAGRDETDPATGATGGGERGGGDSSANVLTVVAPLLIGLVLVVGLAGLHLWYRSD